MTTQAGHKKERDFPASCMADADTMLDNVRGVDPHGLALIWLDDQFVILRRGDWPPAHVVTL